MTLFVKLSFHEALWKIWAWHERFSEVIGLALRYRGMGILLGC